MEEVRNYTSSSIEDLEVLFAAHAEDLLVLSQIVRELSFRKTKRARRLLALIAGRLADYDAEADQVESFDNDLQLPEDASGVLEDEDPRTVSGDCLLTSRGSLGHSADQPPDDRKRPERLSQIRPVGTPGLPSPWTRQLHGDRPL
jgi:hypothetical protein